MSQQDPHELELVLGLLKRFGAQATSFQVLEPGYRYWLHDDACIAFAHVPGAFVTAGEPIAREVEQRHAAHAFVEDARVVKRRVCFFHVSEAFAKECDFATTPIGELPWWDPKDWEGVLAKSRSLREQLRRARAKGVRISEPGAREIASETSPLRKKLDGLIDAWLRSRTMQRMRFMVHVYPFTFPEERAYAVAWHDDEPVGLAVAVPIYAENGWFIEDLIRSPDAPNGTVELLIDFLMRRFHAQGATKVTLGLAPLSGEISGALAFTRDVTGRLYNFAGVRAFKQKLLPHHWERVVLAYPRDQEPLLVMRDVLRAFAPEGFIRFGFNTFVRRMRRGH